MNKNIAIFALIMLTLGSFATYSAPSVFADWLIDSSGTLIKLDPNVLDDVPGLPNTGNDLDRVEVEESPKPETDTTLSEEQRELLKKREEANRETLKDQREQVREAAKQQLERKIELNKRNNKNVENEFELSTSDGELKVKQKTKFKNGVEKETELELKENETLHVDQEGGESVDIDVVSAGELEITKDKFKGRTRLPLSVNSNNELMVTRPDGSTKIVSVLPDQAVTKMLENGVLVSVDNVELTTNESGEPVYQVKQEVNKKFLGFIAMKFGSETSVSATDATDVTTTSTETSPWRKFMERLAR